MSCVSLYKIHIFAILWYITGHTITLTTLCYMTDIHNPDSEELELGERKSEYLMPDAVLHT